MLYRLGRLLWRFTRPTTVGVRLILVQEGAFLLVKHTYQAGWYLPGGGVKKGETVEEAARREAQEECGARLGDLNLIGVYTNFYDPKNDHVIVLSCDAFTLSGETDFEIECPDFCRAADLPAYLSPGSRKRIKEYARGDGPVLGRW